MAGKIIKNFMIFILLVVSAACFTFGLIAVPKSDCSEIFFPDEAGSSSSGKPAISNMKAVVNIPDAIASTRENNMNLTARDFHEVSRRYNNKPGVIFILLMLLSCRPALMLRLQYSIAKTSRADMPILALSLGGNSPPVIHA